MKLNHTLHHLLKQVFRHILIRGLFLLLVAVNAGSLCRAQTGTINQNEIQEKIKEILKTVGESSDITKATADTLERLYNQSKKQGYNQNMADAGIALMAYYMTYGTYQKVIELGNDIKTIKPISEKNAANLHRLLGNAYSSMGMVDNAYEEYHLAIQFVKKIEDKDTRHYLLAISYQNLTDYFDRTGMHIDSIIYYDTMGLKEAKLVSSQSRIISNDQMYGLIIAMQYTVGLDYMIYRHPPEHSLAGKYFLAALKLNEKRKGKISREREINLYTSVSRFYLFEKKYDSSVEYGLKALYVESGHPSPYKRTVIYKALAQAYEAENNKEQSLKYMNLLMALNDSLQNVENDETGTTVKQMMAREKESNAQKTRKTIGIAAGIVLASLLISFLLWRKNKAALQKKYKQLIEKLNAEKEKPAMATEAITDDRNITTIHENVVADDFAEDENNSESPKESAPVNIPRETVAMLLAKLEKFEKSGEYLEKDVNLISLAHQLGSNSKYLSEIIKQHKEKTFINYINGLKIDYITRKLYEDAVYREYKISHLAEECGFASRQVFVLAFKRETGVTPSYFISRLKDGGNL